MTQIEDMRRRQEALERVHQLRLQRFDELARLRYDELSFQQRLQLEELEARQELRLTSGQRRVELQHQYRLLEYREGELQVEIGADRERQRSEIDHQAALARIELGKKLVEARLVMLDRLSTGEVELEPALVDKLFAIDPMDDREITPEHISRFMEAINAFLEQGGVEKVRSAVEQLTAPVKPALPRGEESSTHVIDGESVEESSTPLRGNEKQDGLSNSDGEER